jgi:hypothetical protein
MSLDEEVLRFRQSPAMRQQPLPPRSATAKAARHLARRLTRTALVDRTDYEALLARLRRVQETGDWHGLEVKDLRHAPRVLWDAPPLAADPAFLESFLAAVGGQRGRLAKRALAREYLRRFAPDLPGLEPIGRLLRQCRQDLPRPWSEAGCAGRLFSTGDGARGLGLALLDGREPVEAILEAHGLDGELTGSGIKATAFAFALQMLEQRLRKAHDPALIERVMGWAQTPEGQLRYTKLRPRLAEALLRPWIEADPFDAALRRSIEVFLLRHLKDPRLHRDGWLGVDPDAQAVMLRWLARASLETFLRVFDRHAVSHQWEKRRRFWLAYANGGHVANAHVVFAPALAAEAREMARRTRDATLAHFAELDGGGFQPNHAVLLLEIGRLVIADWSHNGALRIWQRGDRSAPRLDRRRYGADELRREPLDGHGRTFLSLRHDPSGHWRQTAHDFISRHTSIRLLSRDYL